MNGRIGKPAGPTAAPGGRQWRWSIARPRFRYAAAGALASRAPAPRSRVQLQTSAESRRPLPARGASGVGRSARERCRRLAPPHRAARSRCSLRPNDLFAASPVKTCERAASQLSTAAVLICGAELRCLVALRLDHEDPGAGHQRHERAHDRDHDPVAGRSSRRPSGRLVGVVAVVAGRPAARRGLRRTRSRSRGYGH